MDINEAQTSAIKDFLFLLSEYDGVTVTTEVLLKHLCEYFDADRACTFEQKKDDDCAISTYEWCKEGLPKVMDNQRNAKKATFKFWDERFKSEIGIYIEVNDEMKRSDPKTYEVLSKSKVQCLMAAPPFCIRGT